MVSQPQIQNRKDLGKDVRYSKAEPSFIGATTLHTKLSYKMARWGIKSIDFVYLLFLVLFVIIVIVFDCCTI